MAVEDDGWETVYATDPSRPAQRIKCPNCRGQGLVVGEMGCFGPKSFERCKLCHGRGTPGNCFACEIEKAVIVFLAAGLWRDIPLCENHLEASKLYP